MSRLDPRVYGEKYEWIHNFCALAGWSLVDSTRSKTEEATTKNWKGALEALLEAAKMA